MRRSDIIRFFVLILIQVLILNHVDLFGIASPFIYVLYILVLPFEISGSVSLLTAFAMGMTIDMFSYSHGVHTISLLLLAFVRPFLIRLMIRREEFGSKASPSIEQMGFRNFYVYMLILVLIHHTCLYLVDFFSLSQPLHMIRSILLSTLFTTILIIISQALFPDKQK